MHRGPVPVGRSAPAGVYHNRMDYAALATPERVAKTATALAERGFEPLMVADRAAALAKVKEFIAANHKIHRLHRFDRFSLCFLRASTVNI